MCQLSFWAWQSVSILQQRNRCIFNTKTVHSGIGLALAGAACGLVAYLLLSAHRGRSCRSRCGSGYGSDRHRSKLAVFGTSSPPPSYRSRNCGSSAGDSSIGPSNAADRAELCLTPLGYQCQKVIYPRLHRLNLYLAEYLPRYMKLALTRWLTMPHMATRLLETLWSLVPR